MGSNLSRARSTAVFYRIETKLDSFENRIGHKVDDSTKDLVEKLDDATIRLVDKLDKFAITFEQKFTTRIDSLRETWDLGLARCSRQSALNERIARLELEIGRLKANANL